MPSDSVSHDALEALNRRANAFRSAVALTADQLRGHLEEHRVVTEGQTPAAVAALGKFAAGRVDPDRMSRLLSPKVAGGSDWAEPVGRALAILEEIASHWDKLFRVRVDDGGDLTAAVEQALANAGRAFGAARVAGLARSSRYQPEAHDGLLESFPFRRWSAGERKLAPPLVVVVAGGDLNVGGLANYLDGTQAIVLVVEGQSPPAPLARLVSPGVFVMQTEDVSALRQIAEVAGPAVAAVVPAEAASFVHRPGHGDAPGRTEAGYLPSPAQVRPLGSLSTFQQREDLKLLAALAGGSSKGVDSTAAAAVVSANGSAAAHPEGHGNGSSPAPVAIADPADALVTWLLSRVDLSDLEG